MKKGLFALVLLLAAGGLGWRFLLPKAPGDKDGPTAGPPPDVAVKKGSLRVTVEATGRVVPNQEIEIKCKASGEIIELPVDVSAPVKKGDLLVRLDPNNEERSVKRSEIALAVSEARLSQARLGLKVADGDLASERARAEAAFSSAEARAKEARARLDRVNQLAEKKMASAEELDGARTAEAQAASDLEGARARVADLKTREIQIESRKEDLRIAQAAVESDKLALSDAKQRFSDTTVTAPIDGVVAAKNVQVGQIIASGTNNVGGGTTLLTLADLSRNFVLVSVDESDIGRIDIGQRANVTVDAYPDSFFPGEVVRVATKGVNSSNVVTFEVKVEVQGPNRRLLKPEMTATVEITAVEKEDVLLIPAAALQRRRRDRFATVRKPDGTTEERPVKTGASDGEMMEIVEGLAEGEKIVLPAGAQGPWRKGDGRGGDEGRRDRMRMRMMGGGN